jgi:hypothetical protein
MDTISGKGVLYALLPILVLVQLSSLTEAVDIIFYDRMWCDGNARTFENIPPQVCCSVSPGTATSVWIDAPEISQLSNFFRDGDCTTQVGTGFGNYCQDGGQLTGAFWYNSRRRSLLGDAPTCDTQMSKPTGVVYTEAGTKRSWILMYAQMQKMPDAEKISWLQSHGASYKEL